MLLKYVTELFPDSEIHTNYRHPSLLFERSSMRMEFDIFIPDLSLILEYQGDQHYKWHYVYGSPQSVKERDEEKKRVRYIYPLSFILSAILSSLILSYPNNISRNALRMD